MSSFDDIFSSQGSGPNWNEKPFDKDAWAAKKQGERQELYALADSTAQEVGQDGDRFRQYLDVQSRFDRYSATNALLVLAQMPEATQLKDFDDWKEAGASVQRRAVSKTINMAIDTESANIEKILKARGNGDSVSASEIITTFTEKAENIPVPDAVDDRIMEIIERIAAPIEKKKRNQKTAKRITTLLIACFLIWAVSNAVSAVTSEEINSKATNTATEAAFESAATAATTEPTNTNANE